jgi:hypothetical protein
LHESGRSPGLRRALLSAPSHREFIQAMGRYLEQHGGPVTDSIVWEAYRYDLPIFCPAFSDCSAGFGLVAHQHARGAQPKVSIDSAQDFGVSSHQGHVIWSDAFPVLEELPRLWMRDPEATTALVRHAVTTFLSPHDGDPFPVGAMRWPTWLTVVSVSVCHHERYDATWRRERGGRSKHGGRGAPPAAVSQTHQTRTNFWRRLLRLASAV